jgi:hypothetical protein
LVDLLQSEHAERIIMFSVQKSVDIVRGNRYAHPFFLLQRFHLLAQNTLGGKTVPREGRLRVNQALPLRQPVEEPFGSIARSITEVKTLLSATPKIFSSSAQPPVAGNRRDLLTKYFSGKIFPCFRETGWGGGKDSRKMRTDRRTNVELRR